MSGDSEKDEIMEFRLPRSAFGMLRGSQGMSCDVA